MKQQFQSSKDNVLMSVLVMTGLVMATLGPVVADADTNAAMNSAGRVVKSVATPTAMESIQYREAAIIVTAPRLRSSV
jgi:hypothetical protein